MIDSAIFNRRNLSVYRAVFACGRWSLPAIAIAWGLTADRPAIAETILSSAANNSAYVSLSAESQYAASGYITIPAGGGQYHFGSATLIAPDWVLTSADLVTQTGPSTLYSPTVINFGQGATATIPATGSVTQVVVESGWSSSLTAGDDLALVQLSTPITSVAPAAIYPSSLGSELAQTSTIIGYGESGTGATGEDTAAGTRMGINQTIDAFGGSTTTGGTGIQYSFSTFSSNLMLTDFDEPGVASASLMGSSTPLTLEGSPALGDSGGGLFLTASNGLTYLAGVTSFTGAFPNNALSTNGDGHYGDFSAYTRLDVTQSMTFIDNTLQTTSNWLPSGNGTWDSLSNWSSSLIPEFAGATANFTSAISTSATVTLDANWTLGTINFNNTHSYTIASGSNGSLTLDNGANAAAINDLGGTHVISANVQLNSPLNLTVTNAADTLKITGNLTDNPNNGAQTLTLSGNGTLALSGTNTYTLAAIKSGTLVSASLHALPTGGAIADSGTLSIQAGTIAAPVLTGAITGSGTLSVGTSSTPGYLQLEAGGATNTLGSLTVAPTSTLDITNNTLIINYPSGNDPAAMIRGYLQTGYNQDKWNGDGIISSNAAANPGLYAVGYADGNTDVNTPAEANQIYIKNTLAGDANLDGLVNFSDLLVVAQDFGRTGQDWAEGDFNYDGIVNFSDLLLVAQNFGKQLSAGQLSQLPGSFAAEWQLAQTEVTADQTSSVPEPATTGLLILGAAGLLARRRRLSTVNHL